MTEDGRFHLLMCNNCKLDFCSECAEVYHTCEKCGSHYCLGCSSVIEYRKEHDQKLCKNCYEPGKEVIWPSEKR